MNRNILLNLAKIIKDEFELLKTYNDTTGESLTMEEMLSELAPKRTPKKIDFRELLPMYCEAVADMKRVKTEEMDIDSWLVKHIANIKNFEV